MSLKPPVIPVISVSSIRELASQYEARKCSKITKHKTQNEPKTSCPTSEETLKQSSGTSEPYERIETYSTDMEIIEKRPESSSTQSDHFTPPRVEANGGEGGKKSPGGEATPERRKRARSGSSERTGTDAQRAPSGGRKRRKRRSRSRSRRSHSRRRRRQRGRRRRRSTSSTNSREVQRFIDRSDHPEGRGRRRESDRMPSRADFPLDVSFEMNPEWESILKDEFRRSYIGYLKNPFEPETLEQWWNTTMENVEWLRPLVDGKELPRYAAFFVDKGCKCKYRYSGTKWEGTEYPPWFLEITKQVMAQLNTSYLPNSCNVNLYEDGNQSVGWHSDNEIIFQSRHRDCLIVSLSLGAKRKFQFRRQWGEGNPSTVELSDGDLMTMEGLFQRFFSHRVPREPQVKEPRINFTWRWITLHFHSDGCPLHGNNAGAPGYFFQHLK